jgi:hypothetical protein
MKLIFILISFLFAISRFFSQNSAEYSSSIPHKFQDFGGIVSTYFWEEDSLGRVVNREVYKPFVHNYYFAIDTVGFQSQDISKEQVVSFVKTVLYQASDVNERHKFTWKDSVQETKYFLPLSRKLSLKQASTCCVKREGKWKSFEAKKVMYFVIKDRVNWFFSHSSDSIVLKKQERKYEANSGYIVLTFLERDGDTSKQQVFTYSGENVTHYLTSDEPTINKMQSKRLLIFVNGYRGYTKETDETDHLVTAKDRYFYWYKLDNNFIRVLQPAQTYYVDASMSVSTSNHKQKRKFLKSWLLASYVFRKQKARTDFSRLNRESNSEGFHLRKEQGRIGAKALLAAICNSPACQGVVDTLDIVCHSMGYSYTLGMIEELQGKVIFGKIYILSPENACEDGVDWTQFEEVWQYGSNLDQPDPDPVWEQDGVAPQCQVKGLEIDLANKHGRAFIPKDWKRKNFIDSHMVYNYDWIFERIKKGEAGYITK